MQTETGGPLAGLKPVKMDSLLQLIQLARADTRPNKIDVGVGVYRSSNGATPIIYSNISAHEFRLGFLVGIGGN